MACPDGSKSTPVPGVSGPGFCRRLPNDDLGILNYQLAAHYFAIDPQWTNLILGFPSAYAGVTSCAFPDSTYFNVMDTVLLQPIISGTVYRGAKATTPGSREDKFSSCNMGSGATTVTPANYSNNCMGNVPSSVPIAMLCDSQGCMTRGHQVSSSLVANMYGKEGAVQSMSMCNMSPQTGAMNNDQWSNFESMETNCIATQPCGMDGIMLTGPTGWYNGATGGYITMEQMSVASTLMVPVPVAFWKLIILTNATTGQATNSFLYVRNNTTNATLTAGEGFQGTTTLAAISAAVAITFAPEVYSTLVSPTVAAQQIQTVCNMGSNKDCGNWLKKALGPFTARKPPVGGVCPPKATRYCSCRWT